MATKQTLLSVLLANHALLETYLQDEDSQMDAQSKLEEPLVNAQPTVRRMKITANLICLLLSYTITLLCHIAMFKMQLLRFQIKLKV